MKKSHILFMLALFVGIIEHQTLTGQLLIGATCIALMIGAVVYQEVEQ